MILKTDNSLPGNANRTSLKKPGLLPLWLFVTLSWLSGCGIYKFKDVSIDPNAKTCHVGYIDNRARFVNPELSPQLTDKLRQKINNQTRLTQVQGEADYDITGTITGYDVTTAGISNQQAATNRLIVTVHVIFKNRLNEKKNFEADVSRNFDFAATLSLDQAQAQLTSTIIQNMVDEIFNRIFSDW
jgi:hypothetical protein